MFSMNMLIALKKLRHSVNVHGVCGFSTKKSDLIKNQCGITLFYFLDKSAKKAKAKGEDLP